MKLIFMILLFLSSGVVLSEDFDTKPKQIESIDTPQGYKEIIFRDYKFSIPDGFSTEMFDDKRIILRKNGKGMFFISFSTSHLLKGFRSRKEFLTRLFDYSDISHNDLNEIRKARLNYSDNVEVYKRDDFIFFREDKKDDTKIKTDITISSPKDDHIMLMSFLVDDEKLKMNVIQSFKLK